MARAERVRCQDATRAPFLPLTFPAMSAPDDDDEHEIGDHGTVVMPRDKKMQLQLALTVPRAPKPLPVPPPPPSHVATMNPAITATRPAANPQASSVLPTLPPALTGLPSG